MWRISPNIFALILKDMTAKSWQVTVMKGKMQFKDFVFDVNPSVIEVHRQRNIHEKTLLSGRCKVRNGAEHPVQISGKGVFYGDAAYENYAMLEMLYRKSSAGWLYLPSGDAYRVYFKELTVSYDSAKNRCEYSFLFVECTNIKKPFYDFRFTVAEENENMFHIADRCRVSVESLMELNDYKTPFSVQAGDRVVLK